MSSNKLDMVKCEKFTNNVPNNHTEKSVNFPVIQSQSRPTSPEFVSFKKMDHLLAVVHILLNQDVSHGRDGPVSIVSTISRYVPTGLFIIRIP